MMSRTQVNGKTQSWNLRWFACHLCLLMVVVVILGCGGCSPYELRGTVMAGPRALVLVVGASDARLKDEGLGGAAVELVLDPNSISPKRLGTVLADSHGRFRVGVEALGAGSFQKYDLGLRVTAKGYRNLWRTIELPASGKRLLVILKPGSANHGDPSPPGDILGETLKLKNQLMGQ